MPYNFDTLSDTDAIRLIAVAHDPLIAPEALVATDAISQAETSAATRAYLAGDHWQDGAGWVGPMPVADDSIAPDTFAKTLIEQRFVSRNMIEDVVTRHVDGVVGREPSWGFTTRAPLASDEAPSSADQTKIDATEAALTAWWDKRRIHALLQRGVGEMILSGRAVLRLYVPAARLNIMESTTGTQSTVPQEARAITSAGQAAGSPAGPQLVPETSASSSAIDTTSATQNVVTASTLDDALDQIFVEIVVADDAAVFIDADSEEKLGIVVYYRQGDAIGTTGPRVVELSYLDSDARTPIADRNTILRVVGINETGAPMPFALGGRLMHYAMERPPLVGSSLISLQKALNLSCSMLSRNVETTQYLERILSNSQLPGHWEIGLDGERTGNFIEGTYVTGAGVTTTVQGAEIDQPDGTKTLATPSVTFRPPTEVRPTVEAIDALVAEMLREAKQAHVLGNDQVQSGVSRTQARADYEKSLGRSQSAIEPAGRWLLETVLTLGQLFAGTVGEEGDASVSLRAEFNCLTDTGPLDPTEKTAITQAGQLGFLSREWVQQALGVEDTDAENARINTEPGKDVQIRTLKAAALKAYVDAGLSLTAAAELAGFEDDEIKLIEKDEAANPVPAPGQPAMTPKLDANGQPVIDPATGQPVMEPNPNAMPNLLPNGMPNPNAPPPTTGPQPGVTPPALAPFAAANKAAAA